MIAPLLAALLQSAAPEPPPAPALDPAAVRIMADYARCAARAQPRRAAGLVLADDAAPDYAPALRRFAQDQRACVPRGGRLGFGPLAFSGGLAEQLLKDRGTDAAALAAAPDAPQASGFAACVVHRAPDAVAALFATAPAGKAEAAAIAPLRAVLPGCLRAGDRLVMNPVALRAMLALASYRMVTAAAR